VRVTNPVTTIEARVIVRNGNASLATISGDTVRVDEAVNAHERANAGTSIGDASASNTVVAEDGARRQIAANRRRHGLGQVNVQMMAEQPRVLHRLGLHDRAIHKATFVHENAVLVDIPVRGDLAAILPLAIDIDAVNWGVNSARASEVAAIATRAGNIDDARGRVSGRAINARESLAVNAIIIAGNELSNVGFAAVAGISVAIGSVGDTVEDAVTAGLNVSGITVAVRNQVGNVNVVQQGVLVEIVALNSRGEGSGEVQEKAIAGVRARSGIEIEASVVAEVETSL